MVLIFPVNKINEERPVEAQNIPNIINHFKTIKKKNISVFSLKCYSLAQILEQEVEMQQMIPCLQRLIR